MGTSDLLDRFLGFMPQRSVIWWATGSFVFSLILQYATYRIKKILILPWLKVENQNKRQKMNYNDE